ncbi:MAG: UvrB/UvrC motif-containing protein [bacterium]
MLDISRVLEGWDYVPDEVHVRLIEGEDKKLKIQMRLDLGLLQMEYNGRPDGKRPHGQESYLCYYQQQLRKYVKKNGTDEGFFLNADDCAILQNESMQYYYRYLSLFHLQEYEAVVRDTARNLEVFDFIKKYAGDEDDQLILEQYRPYVVMMNTRAAAHLRLEKNRPDEAVQLVEIAIRQLEVFFQEYDRPDLVNKCSEVLFLRQFAEDIRTRWSANPVRELREKMMDAAAREDFETAAFIRDEIKKLSLKIQG